MPDSPLMSPEALAEQIGQSVLGGLETLCIAIGDQLGLYATLEQLERSVDLLLDALSGRVVLSR